MFLNNRHCTATAVAVLTCPTLSALLISHCRTPPVFRFSGETNPIMPRRFAAILAAIALSHSALAEPVAGTDAPLTSTELANLKSQADYSDHDAQYRLGMLYLHGTRGVEKNREKAVLLLKNAALQNHAEAAYELGNFLAQTPSGDGNEAMKWLRLAAGKDLPKAQSAVADLYFMSGEPALAAEWYGKSAKQGDLRGKTGLGALLLMGQGVSKDEKRGIELIRDAAEKGDAQGQLNLTSAYLNGTGVEKDEKQGVNWLKKAEQGGHPEAQYQLGRLYFFGAQSLPRDLAESEKCLRAAISKGHRGAQVLLELLKKDAQSPKFPVKNLIRLAENGDRDAMLRLVYAYEEGNELKQNDVEEEKWLLRLIDANSGATHAILGHIYSRDKGVKPNPVEAYARFALASERTQNDSHCVKMRDEVAARLGPDLEKAKLRLKALREEFPVQDAKAIPPKNDDAR
jgi:TPR repeat protein